MKYLKTYEQRLRDLPIRRDIEPNHKTQYKYKKGDLVKVIELDKLYIVGYINDNSDNQDYFLYDPFDKYDRAWVKEEELAPPTPKELEEIGSRLKAEEYNL